MTRTLWIDFETFNTVDISAGTYRYAETAEILLCAWAIDDEPAQVWDIRSAHPGWKPPEAFGDALLDPDVEIVAHNAMFDRAILRSVWPNLAAKGAADPERWKCTMVKAMLHGFPGSLDALCQILGVPADKAKIQDGKRLIQRFCKPAPKNHKAERYGPDTHPEDWARFVEYARLDIDAMREIDARLPWFNETKELPLWHLDQRINDRGFLCDMDLVCAGVRAAATEKDALAARFRDLTGGMVDRPTMREEFRTYLNHRFGTSFEDTKKATFDAYLRDNRDADSVLAELLGISMQANKTSTSKYVAAEKMVSSDGRLRGSIQFSGAARTRRNAGRGLQIQNLPSRGLPPQDSTDRYIEALKLGCHDFLFDDLMGHASAALRAIICAPEDKHLLVADYSSIEGRVLAWEAGEQWKLDAYSQGDDLYKVTAGRILGKPTEEVTKAERSSLGKVSELALGYAGGANAFQVFAAGYGVRMSDYTPMLQRDMGAAWAQAVQNWETWGAEKAGDTPKEEWLPSETIKIAWRETNPKISLLWKSCEKAFRLAYESPGKAFRAGPRLIFKALSHAEKNYVVVRLPSGRFITYFDPLVDEDGSLSHMGVNQLTRQWQRIPTYGGKIVENCTQSIARDILIDALPKVEALGARVLLTVHDEVVCEAPTSLGVEPLEHALSAGHDWTDGLPLSAEGFAATRYRK